MQTDTRDIPKTATDRDTNVIHDRSDAELFSASGITVRLSGALIVDDVSMTGRSGEVVGIIGPNGAGKTTLLKVLAGLRKPTQGEVSIRGEGLSGMPSSTRSKRIAYVPQSSGEYPFTVLETVLMGRYPHLRRFQIESEDDAEFALAAMERMDVSQFKDRRLATLSGGERQRVLLARALAQQSNVMFVDEPTSSLDIKHQLLSLQALKDEAQQRQVAVCAVLHDLNMAAKFCDRLVLMAHGRMVAQGTPSSVLTVDRIQDVFGVAVQVSVDADSDIPKVDLVAPV